MNKIVNLRRVGKFYQAYEDDAYVIHAIMGYNVSNGRVGFPVNSLSKVQSKLDECKISYKIIDKDSIIDSKDFRDNNMYDKFLDDGILSMDKIMCNKSLIEIVKNLPDEKVEKIINYINEVISEK